MIEFRLRGFASRWRLGEALAKIERAPGRSAGKKELSQKFLSRQPWRESVYTKAAIEAQRTACWPARKQTSLARRLTGARRGKKDSGRPDSFLAVR
jgi:hypothetical protein